MANNDKPISVGDLVQVVKPCCDHYAGLTFVVEKLIDVGNWVWVRPTCEFCGYRPSDKMWACGAPPPVLPLSMLKRIPPLADATATT